MDVIKAANDLLAFLLQIAALAAVGVRGFTIGSSLPTRLVLGVGARRDPIPPGCGIRRLQDGQRRTHGRGRARRLADFMLRKADSSTREGRVIPMLASP